MKQSKYVDAAMKVVKSAGYGGGEKMYSKYSKMLDKILEKAKEAGDEDSVKNIGFMYEAIMTASTLD